MRTFLALLLCISVARSIAAQSPAPNDTPSPKLDPKETAMKMQPGTYLWTGDSWKPMQQLNMSGGGLKHVGKMFVPGLTPQMVWTFRESQAPVQIRDEKPLFCVKFIATQPGTPYAPSGCDLVIVRFDQKKDHRELQTTSGGNVFTFKGGLSKDRMPDIQIDGLDSTTYLISPKEALSAGEYLLSASSMGISGYDFGFHPPK